MGRLATDRRIDLFVPARFPEAGENVIGVGRDDEFAHRQPHPLGVVACKNVSKVACGDDELNFGIIGGDTRGELRLELEVGNEVVHCLGEDASPVDGIDCSEMVFVVECPVSEESFDDILNRQLETSGKKMRLGAYLAVVERGVDCDVVNVCIGHCCHLCFLNRGNTAFRMENEDGDVGLVTEAIDRSAECSLSSGKRCGTPYAPSSIPTGSSHYCQCLLGFIGRLSGVSPKEEEFEQVAK